MKNLKTTIVSLLLIATTNATAQTNDRFNDLTYDYFYNKNSNVSVDVKRVIASDPKSSAKTLEILRHDDDVAVWLLAEENIKNQ